MTIRFAIRETETHPGKFPKGFDTPVEEIYEPLSRRSQTEKAVRG